MGDRLRDARTDCTPSTRSIERITAFSCFTSAMVTSKSFTAFSPGVVLQDALEMFTPVSLMVWEIFARMPGLS